MERPKIVKRAIDSARTHRREVVAGVALLSAAALAACSGGKADTPKNTPDTGPQTPVATKTAVPEPTPTQVVPTEAPTIEPTPTTAPEGWSDAEIDAQISSAVNLVTTLSDELNPESDFFSTVKDQAQTAWADYNHVIETKDYQSIRTPLDGFTSAGRNIGNFACHETYREVEGRAWVELRDLVLNLSSKYEQLGYIEEGMKET